MKNDKNLHRVGSHMKISIDIGMQYWCVGILNSSQDSLLRKMKKVNTTLFLEEDGTFCVGRQAIEKGKKKQEYLCKNFKQKIGDKTGIKVGDKIVSVERLYTELFSYIRTEVSKNHKESIEKVVLTYPIFYGEEQKKLLITAAKSAGFGEVEAISEPEAVAMEYKANHVMMQNGDIVLVYHWGAGSFYATLLELKNGKFSLLGTSRRLEKCLGMEMDRVIYEDILSNICIAQQDEREYQAFCMNLLEIAEQVKCSLSTNESFEEEWDFVTYSLKREEFEKWITPMVEETISECQKLLKETKQNKKNVKAILLSGGICNIPLVRKKVEEFEEKENILAYVSKHPENVVVHGALRSIQENQKEDKISESNPKNQIRETTEINKSKTDDVPKNVWQNIQENKKEGKISENNEEKVIGETTEIKTDDVHDLQGRTKKDTKNKKVIFGIVGIVCLFLFFAVGKFIDNKKDDIDTESEVEIIIPEKETTMYALSDIKVRSEASDSCEVLGVIVLNQEVTALGDAENGWQMIRFDGGKQGIAYVSVQYLGTEKNDPFSLGLDYELGKGVPQSYEEAVKWYRKSAEQGDANGQNALGECYYYGRGVEQDYEEAVKWLQKSAEQGNVNAQNLLDKYNELNHEALSSESESKQKEEDVEYFQNAKKFAEQGDANAQNNLGVCYDCGIGVIENQEEAVKWYKKSAEQGHELGQYNLGNSYYYGHGVSQDYEEAVKWYRKSAEQGLADAEENLGNCYYNGDGVLQSYEEAVKWYRKSAEQNFASAQYMLGCCYEYGHGVPQDYDKAIEYYKKSAEQGDRDALEKIGTEYLKNLK